MKLVLAVTGATGASAARLLAEKSPWPVLLVASEWGKRVYERECGPFSELSEKAAEVYEDTDLAAAISSGSVGTVGMAVLPCSTNTLAKVASGVADSLITRAAHCHLKERRKLVLCVRESPWSTIDCENAARVSSAGGIVMPVSPPFYMADGRKDDEITLREITEFYVDRVISVLGGEVDRTWESCS
jgi:4-hydroxy-3-polyprenylbenzoate decarboxylase